MAKWADKPKPVSEISLDPEDILDTVLKRNKVVSELKKQGTSSAHLAFVRQQKDLTASKLKRRVKFEATVL